jgi:hypothetical protein
MGERMRQHSTRSCRRWLRPLLIATSLCYAAAGCHGSDDSERIRQLVRGAAQAAGERDVAAVMAVVAGDFTGRLGFDSGDDIIGVVDARQLRFLLARYLQRGSGPNVLIRSIDVVVNGAQAQSTVVAMITQRGGAAGPRGEIAPDRGEMLRLELKLEKRDGKWLVVAAQRTPIAAGEFLLGK